jgi:hypothetical protein
LVRSSVTPPPTACHTCALCIVLMAR